MHLALVTMFLPAASPRDDGDFAVASLAGGLRRAGADVSVVGYARPGVELPQVGNPVSLGAPPSGTGGGAMRRLAGILTGGPDEPRLRDVLVRLDPVGGYVLDGLALAGACERRLSGKPFVYVAHPDVRNGAVAPGGGVADWLIARGEARRARALDTRLRRGACAVLALPGSPGSGEGPVPLALPVVMPRLEEAGGERVPAFDIGLLDDWMSEVNRAGLEWFLQDVAPKLHPDVTIAVAGQLPRGFPNRGDRILFLGRLNEPREFLRQCRVVALPAISAGAAGPAAIGTFELGLPAVATGVSLTGVAVVPANVTRADTPAAFATALHEAVVGQRTGALADLDGRAFHAAQVARLDEILKQALDALEGAAKR